MKLPSISGFRLWARAGNRFRRSRFALGFTMVEIAIALGVIGFALVAIIGILPAGLEVQRDNRTETIINQDGTFWLEAIRNGAKDLDELVDYVERIEIVDAVTDVTLQTYQNFKDGKEIIGLLTHQVGFSNEVARAFVWAVSGSAAEKEPNKANKEMSFKYRMTVHVEQATNAVPFSMFATNVSANVVGPLESLRVLRLTFAYPLVNDDYKPTPRRQSYRALVSREVMTNVVGAIPYFYFYQ